MFSHISGQSGWVCCLVCDKLWCLPPVAFRAVTLCPVPRSCLPFFLFSPRATCDFSSSLLAVRFFSSTFLPIFFSFCAPSAFFYFRRSPEFSSSLSRIFFVACRHPSFLVAPNSIFWAHTVRLVVARHANFPVARSIFPLPAAVCRNFVARRCPNFPCPPLMSELLLKCRCGSDIFFD